MLRFAIEERDALSQDEWGVDQVAIAAASEDRFSKRRGNTSTVNGRGSKLLFNGVATPADLQEADLGLSTSAAQLRSVSKKLGLVYRVSEQEKRIMAFTPCLQQSVNNSMHIKTQGDAFLFLAMHLALKQTTAPLSACQNEACGHKGCIF